MGNHETALVNIHGGMANSKRYRGANGDETMELTTFAAARIFDANPVVLQRLVAQGRLQARKDKNGHWQISRKSLEIWNKRRLARREKQRERVSNEQATPVGVGA